MKSWYQKEKGFQTENLFDYMEAEPDVAQFLEELSLLYHVPYCYLLPADEMLKEEQMCFFYLDPEWVKCLRLGALSIGAESETEKMWSRNAELMCPEFQVRSGFFLRSEAVRRWPGMEVACWSDENVRTAETRLAVLRLERIAGDTLLCIVQGDVKAVQISQPPEGIYMEAKNKSGDEGAKVRFRPGGDGVVDIRAMAAAMAPGGKDTPEDFGALFLHKQDRYLFVPDRQP